MPTATDCLHGRTRISIDRALSLKGQARARHQPDPSFRCTECGNPVKPHRGGGHAGAHFEHFERNARCTLSHRERRTDGNVAPIAEFDLNDTKAIEGYELDRKITTLARNAGIVAKRKKGDDHTCQACGFRLQVNGRFVIECHHTKPLAANKVREVSVEELVCLCPTCHRIAHTRREPFSVREIKTLLGQPYLYVERTGPQR